MIIEKDADFAAKRVFVDGDVIRLVNKAFPFCFKEARLSFTGSSDMERNNYCGQRSMIKRLLTGKDGDLSSHFDIIGESETQIQNTSLKHLLINNQDVAAKKGKKKDKYH